MAYDPDVGFYNDRLRSYADVVRAIDAMTADSPAERDDDLACTAAERERDTAIDLADAMDAGLPVSAWDGVPW